MVSTTAGGRPLNSAAFRPGATNGGSIDLDAGGHMVPSPWERRSFFRGMRQGGAVAREMSSGNQVRVGQWGATSRTCSSSSLSLHSVCASRLTGGNAYLRKAQGQLCASVSVPRGPSVREKYSWQWEDSGEANRSTLSFPESTPDQPDRLGMESSLSGECGLSWERIGPHDWASPGCEQRAVTWTACDSRGGDGGRAVTCDVIIYLPVGWCTRPPQCCPCRLACACPTAVAGNCRKAKCTAHSSRQLMCQSSRGPVQSPEAACSLHVAPQPVLEASVVTTVCRDTCSRATPARRKARSIQGLRERQHCWVIPTRSVPRRHAHLGSRECSQCWSGLIWSNPSDVTAAADAICPRSLWNCFSGTTFLPLKELRQFSAAWARSSVRRAVILTESNSTPRKEILCTGESLLFSQLTRSPNWLRCRSTKSLWSPNCSPDWARRSQSSR